MKNTFVALLFAGMTAVWGADTNVAQRANALQNPGFESDGNGGWLDYNFGPEFGIQWGATDQVHGGKGSLKLSATQKTDDEKKWEMSGAKQIFPVKPGNVISGGAWLKWENLQNVEVFIECKWLDANQEELKGGIGTRHKTNGSGDWEYQNLSMWTAKERTAPEGAAFVDFRLTFLSAGKADIGTGTAWWDDAQFSIETK